MWCKCGWLCGVSVCVYVCVCVCVWERMCEHFYLESITHVGVYCFLLQGGSWERRKEQWEGVGGAAECLGTLSPTPCHSFQSCCMAGYGSSQHCSHALMYTKHAHALSCSHRYTLLLSGTSWVSWCVHFPPWSSAVERPVAAKRFSTSLRQGVGEYFLLGKEKSESGVAGAL